MANRLEKIKAARSLNDVMDVVADIAYELKNSSALVKKIIASISAEISMDTREEPAQKKAVQKNVKLVKFEVPTIASLKKHCDVIEKLSENSDVLDSIVSCIKISFQGVKRQPEALREALAMKQEVTNLLHDAFSALTAVADKHIPKKLAALTDDITNHLIDVLPVKSYKGVFKQRYVIPDPSNKTMFHFCEYISIDELQDSKGYKYDEYFIVLTGVIGNDGAMVYYVNGLPNFKAPGHYPLGKAVSGLTEACKHVDMLLDYNNFVAEIEKLPFPIDTRRANTAGLPNIKGVTSVRIENDECVVFLDPAIKTEKAANNIRIEVLGLLSYVLGAVEKDQLFQSKYVIRGGQKAIKIMLTSNIGHKNNLSLERLREAAEILGLSDKHIAAFRFALQP